MANDICDLRLGGLDAEFIGHVPEDYGVPHVVFRDGAHGAGVLRKRNNQIKHPKATADLKLPTNVAVLVGQDAAVVDGRDFVGTEFVQARARASVKDDERNNDENGEGDQQGLLEPAEGIDHGWAG